MTTAENFAGIDFDEIKEATALEVSKLTKMTTNVPKKLDRFTDVKKANSKLINSPAFCATVFILICCSGRRDQSP
jgi:hypothetical protein